MIMKFYIETYGCTSNMGNSQDLAWALQEMGQSISSIDEADAIIVNTCAVTEKTQRKILRRLKLLPGGRLIVAGCLSAAIPESLCGIRCRCLLGLLDGSSANKVMEVFASAEDAQSGDFHSSGFHSSDLHSGGPHSGDVHQDVAHSKLIYDPDASPKDLCAVVNVAEGCNGTCTYCIVRKARGRLKSRRAEDIIADVKRLAFRGIAEVQLSAQDTACYGLDIGTDLGRLLDGLLEIPGDFKLRLGMMNPGSVQAIEDELLRALKSPRVYRFLHIPVQSGSDRILESMGRRYSAQDFLGVAGSFRSAYPDITIITDVIAGFPGETEWDFQETMNIIDLLQPDKVNITRFSARPGTAASRLYDMPDRIKKDRSRELTRLSLKIALERNEKYVGKLLGARVTEQGRGGSMKARADNYLGVVVKGRPGLGSSVSVLIDDCNAFYVSGQVAGSPIAKNLFELMHRH
jgi:MiaB-like tRNA modifying enzyme